MNSTPASVQGLEMKSLLLSDDTPTAIQFQIVVVLLVGRLEVVQLIVVLIGGRGGLRNEGMPVIISVVIGAR